MKDLTDLLGHLVASRSPEDQVRLLVHFFQGSPIRQRPALAILLGKLPPNRVSVPVLKRALFSRIREELFDVSKPEATDLSETLALLWPGGHKTFEGVSLETILRTTPKMKREEHLFALLDISNAATRDLIIRISTGRFRPPISLNTLKNAFHLLCGHSHWDLDEAIASSETNIEPLTQWLFEDGDKPQSKTASHFFSIPPIIGIEKETSANERCEAMPLPAGDIGEWVISGGSSFWYTLDGEATKDVPSFPALRGSPEATLLALKPSNAAIPPVLIDVIAQNGEDLRGHSWAQRRDRLDGLVEDLAPGTFSLSDRLKPQTLAECEVLLRQNHCRQILSINKKGRLQQGARGYKVLKPGPQSFQFVVLYVEGSLSRQGTFDGLVTLGSISPSNPQSNFPDLVPVGQAAITHLDPGGHKRLEAFIADHTLERFGPVRKLSTAPEARLCALVQVRDIKTAPRRKAGLVLVNPKLIKFLDEPLDDPLSALPELNAFAAH
jgi:ATP-dependent DNA ligase